MALLSRRPVVSHLCLASCYVVPSPDSYHYQAPTTSPTTSPTQVPTTTPTVAPSRAPTTLPTVVRVLSHGRFVIKSPSSVTLLCLAYNLIPSPDSYHYQAPTTSPTQVPTTAPTVAPSRAPTTVRVLSHGLAIKSPRPPCLVCSCPGWR